ncbi:MAG: hypothetical protein M3N53_03715 [Actinomycetota bacterium]|nr:hypothetical protein [Actinomycetota bacterium]
MLAVRTKPGRTSVTSWMNVSFGRTSVQRCFSIGGARIAQVVDASADRAVGPLALEQALVGVVTAAGDRRDHLRLALVADIDDGEIGVFLSPPVREGKAALREQRDLAVRSDVLVLPEVRRRKVPDELWILGVRDIEDQESLAVDRDVEVVADETTSLREAGRKGHVA